MNNSKNPMGYWNEQTTEEALSKVAKELGHFPTQEELRNLGLLKIYSAIYRLNLSLTYFAEKLGYELNMKPNGFWEVWENFEKEIRTIIVNNKMPTQSMMISKYGRGMVDAMYRYHGNIYEIAKKLNCEIDVFHITSDGHYVNSSYEYIFDEYLYSRGIQHEVNNKISNQTHHRYDFRIKEIYFEIWGYGPNRDNKRVERYNLKRKLKEELYKRLNLILISIEENIFLKSISEIEKYFDYLMSSLGFDITKKISNFEIVNSMKGCGFWNEETIQNEVLEVMKENNWTEFPSYGKLYSIKRYDLVDAIKKFGGARYFRNKMGFDQVRKVDGYWSDTTILQELKSVVEQLEHFPTAKELEALDKWDLIKAINRHGGFAKFQKILGCKSKEKWNKDKMIERIISHKKDGKYPSYSDLLKEDPTLISAIDRSKLGYTNLLLECYKKEGISVNEWEVSKQMPPGFWSHKNNRIRYINWLLKLKHMNNPIELKGKDFVKNRGNGLFDYYSSNLNKMIEDWNNH